MIPLVSENVTIKLTNNYSYFTLHIGFMIDVLSLYHYRTLVITSETSQVVRWPDRLADGRLLSDVAEEANAQAWNPKNLGIFQQNYGNHGDFMGFSDGIDREF